MKLITRFVGAFLAVFITLILVVGFGWLVGLSISFLFTAAAQYGPAFLSWFSGQPTIVQILLALVGISLFLATFLTLRPDPEYAEPPKRRTVDEVYPPEGPEPIEDVKRAAQSSSAKAP